MEGISDLLLRRITTEISYAISSEKPHNDHEIIMQINRNLWIYIGSVVLLLSFVGNILCLCVLCRRRMRKLIIGAYLITLTASDLVATVTAVFRMWLFFFWDMDYFAASAPLCKPLIFLQNFSKLCSSWMVVIITVERTFLICRPLIAVVQRPYHLTPGAILFITSIVLTLVVSPTLYYVHVEDKVCTAARTYFDGDQHWEILEALHYTFYSFLPSLIIIPCSLIMVLKLRYNQWGYLTRRKNRWSPSRIYPVPPISVVSVWLPPSFLARMASSTTASTQNQSTSSAPLPLLDDILQNLPQNATFSMRSSPLVPNFQFKNSRVYLSRHRTCRLRHNVRIVLIINVIFLVTTTPLCVLRFMLLFAETFDQSSKHVVFYASQIAALFSDMNLVIYLVLFIASGKAFRNELKSWKRKSSEENDPFSRLPSPVQKTVARPIAR